MDHSRFRNLDAMRGICALTVVLFHCNGLFVKNEIFCHGYLAVDVFFILSGFVLAHTYEKRLAEGLSVGAYMRLRLKRLAPVYWAGTALGILMLVIIKAYAPAGSFFTPVQIAGLSLMALALIPQLTLGGLAYPANAVAWSLGGELMANWIHARWLHKASTRALLGWIALGWGICIAYGYLNPYGWCFGARAADVLMTPPRAFAAFLMGVVLFRAHKAGLLKRLPSLQPLILLTLWIVIAGIPTPTATPTFDMLVVIAASPLLIALLARAAPVAPRAFLWLGTVSYPLYASHLALVFLARNTPLFALDRAPDYAKASLLVAGTIALAWVIHVLVERKTPAGRAAEPDGGPALMEPAQLA
jgi:peptidoglycan/LPS O-acetylase OafA/YrhL